MPRIDLIKSKCHYTKIIIHSLLLVLALPPAEKIISAGDDVRNISLLIFATAFLDDINNSSALS
jgi:hypothetical protein